MDTLKKELSNLFVNHDKSESMMFGECEYDPDYVDRKGNPWPSDCGYAQDLMRAGIDFKSLDSFGGEGEGDQYWHVWEFTRDDEKVLVKFYGWYASYHGAEFTDWSFVEPKQVVVTQYV